MDTPTTTEPKCDLCGNGLGARPVYFLLPRATGCRTCADANLNLSAVLARLAQRGIDTTARMHEDMRWFPKERR